MAKNQTPAHDETATAEQATPRLSEESKGSQKAQVILALCQPGKPLYNFWRSPTQEALQIGCAEIAHSLTSKGKSVREIAEVFSLVGSANASALKQFVEKNLTLPSGAQPTVADARSVLGMLGLD